VPGEEAASQNGRVNGKDWNGVRFIFLFDVEK
jgi:hypothetical protein